MQTILCVTNRRRKALNGIHNRQLAPDSAIECDYEGEDPRAQVMLLWPGLALQAAATDRQHQLKKNALRHTIESVDAQHCKLVRENGETLTVPTLDVAKLFRLVHAITYDSSQARTLYGGIRLTELENPHFSLRRLIVGLGRSPTGALVQLE